MKKDTDGYPDMYTNDDKIIKEKWVITAKIDVNKPNPKALGGPKNPLPSKSELAQDFYLPGHKYNLKKK